MTQQEIKALDEFIVSQNYRNGTTFTRKSFVKAFKAHFKSLKNLGTSRADDMLIMASYTNINKLLRKRGLVMRSRNYYNEFYITDAVQAKIKRLTASIDNMSRTRLELNSALRKGYKTYSLLYDNEIDDIKDEKDFHPSK